MARKLSMKRTIRAQPARTDEYNKTDIERDIRYTDIIYTVNIYRHYR